MIVGYFVEERGKDVVTDAALCGNACTICKESPSILRLPVGAAERHTFVSFSSAPSSNSVDVQVPRIQQHYLF